ncbi:hypothetical protein [Mesoterricola silvestris]|uniref:Vitamin K epoxide reductase domain-containing protein n=1 Tax=Mesoterricola silvestris TaxID=2927979 RepID=A0AA48GPY0_9BACT|nr:hypothetical protein [Mesoterricola silvestris]BDU73555.1 hypothetical protein METEAL_27290 [Mesoterricola silvestris]
MILQAAVLTLLLISALGVAVLLAAAPFALQVIRRWDLASGSELQLRLERRTYLFSTLVAFVMALQLAGILLFVFNADRMAVQFPGAMCAVGTLNAGRFGFGALLGQVALFFLAGMWLTLNHVDSLGRDYPLVRIKYALMIGLLLPASAVLALQWTYLSGLRAQTLTSCCGSLFAEGAGGLAGDLAALPPGPAMAALFGCLAFAVAAAWFLRRRGGYLTGLASAAAFAATLAGITSFLSLYVYEHPHHHCPFCMLKAEFHFVGYALYIPLFLATAAGLGTAVLQPFRGVPTLSALVPAVSARLSRVAAAGFLLVLLVALAILGRSHLILF